MSFDPAPIPPDAVPSSGPRPRRAVVFSGGGAKGVFESGAVHALVRIGFDPDVVSGTSAGALNAVALAEIGRARHDGGDQEAERVLERALSLWERLDREHIADLDRWGWRLWAPAAFAIALALLGARFSLFQWLVAVALIGAAAWIVAGWLALPARLRRTIRRGVEGPPADGRDAAQRRAHSPPAEPSAGVGHRLVHWMGLSPSVFGARDLERALTQVVPAERRFSEYRRCGIDLRLTRTNVRTGRIEISEHLVPADAARGGVDRGRRVLGDPRAVPAAMASAAFPVAFPTVAASRIYPAAENAHLYQRLTERAHAKLELRGVFGAQAKAQYLWLMSVLDELADKRPEWLRTGGEGDLITYLKALFIGERVNWSRIGGRALLCLVETRDWPQLPMEGEPYEDRYFDGGISDNTPLSTALTALRDADARDRDAGVECPEEHEMVVVLVAPLPRRRYLSATEAASLHGPALGARAVRLLADRRLYDDVRNAERIDRLLAEAEDDAPTSTQDRSAPTPEPPRAPESWQAVFARAGDRAESSSARAMVVAAPPTRLARVEVTRVYPAWDLPWVLALDDRLGFQPELARDFQARGCRDTIAAVYHRHAPRARAGRPVPVYAQEAMRHLTTRWDSPPAAGWICAAERCSLREACTRVAAREKASGTGSITAGTGAVPSGEAAPPRVAARSAI